MSLVASLCNRLQGVCRQVLRRPGVASIGGVQVNQYATSSVMHQSVIPALPFASTFKLGSRSTQPLTSLMSSWTMQLQKPLSLKTHVESQLKLVSSQISVRNMATLDQMHVTGPHRKFRPPRKPLDGSPMMKGVVLKTLIKKPKKPNSANRKCVLVRLSNGREAVAYVPGVGHNLQEHNIVLVRVGRLQDVPGVKLKCIRGKYDLAHVQKPQK